MVKSVGIIIVNWNGYSDTIECLESLMRLRASHFKIYIVDNGSTDGSISKIQDWAISEARPNPVDGPWSKINATRIHLPELLVVRPGDKKADQFITIIDVRENLGFAGANNIGMEMAESDTRIDYFWLLNNDTIVDPNCLNALITAASEKPSAAIIGACLMYYHKPDLVQGVGAAFKPWLARGGHLGHLLKRSELASVGTYEKQIDYVMGASMFLPIKTYKEIGPMSEHYFLYFEELDWAKRLGKQRQQTVALDAIVYHKEGGSIGTSSLGRPSDTSLYYMNINLLRYFRKWYPLLLPVAILRILRESLNFLISKDVSALRILAKAGSDFLAGRIHKGKVIVAKSELTQGSVLKN